ncbi:anthranilate synthase component I family protein [Croceitalea sp. MTPC5]|uniref:anthranilate synthase component I family protein n=1 Tax=Croceitalea sp. MTPC5 TaxID=3056565 RepID=UPI002B3DDF06|nr:anthranilate synthase component I family protein [Croceitalea sp. MTPC5]
MRVKTTFAIEDFVLFKDALLYWAQRFDTVLFLDSNGHKDKHSSFEVLLALGAAQHLSIAAADGFQKLSDFNQKLNDWLFGYLSYDLKNELEALSSNNFDGIGFGQLHFFQPKKLIRLTNETVEFLYLEKYADEVAGDFKEISACREGKTASVGNKPKIKLRIHKEAYLDKVRAVLEEIKKGTIYEVNICQEFYAEHSYIDVVKSFLHLNRISKAPFAAFLRLDNHYLLCASPERYLKKNGDTVISQPIKGTAGRSTNAFKDEQFKIRLENDTKERTENIMIVDLVRNDLSKSAVKGSVTVEELCKVYTFEQVHQMISTVSSKTEEDLDAVQLLKDTFPMGSMTGTPKVSAMKVIERVEETKRGLYSGAVGYFDPNKNFDFNVVIRSILYNAEKRYLSFSVGSAITAKSEPLKEYEECLLKAKAMRDVLESN